MGLLSVIEKVRKPGPLSVKNQGIQTGAEGRKKIGRKSFAKVSRNGIKTENPFEGRLWPESKLNGKEAGFIVWDEGNDFCVEGCTMTQRKRLQKAFSLLFVLCLVFSLAGGMSASAEMTLHTGASKEAVSEETNENSEKETEKANAGQAITPVQTEGKTKTPGETAKEKDGRSTEAQGETAQPETAGCTTEAQGETAQPETAGCTTEAQGETAQPETAGESEPHDQTTEGDSGTDAWNQAPITEASAGRRGPQVQNSVITSLEALLKDGSGPVGDVDQWQVFRLNAEFKLPDLMVHEGDTTVITLPEKLKFNQTTEFDIKDGSSNVVAHAVIDGGTKTITLTYTDYTENHSDVSGSFFFYVQMDRDKVDGEEMIPLTIDVSGNTVSGGDIHFKGIGEPQKSTINKSGWQLSDLSNGDHTTLQYQLLVNTAGQAIQSEPV